MLTLGRTVPTTDFNQWRPNYATQSTPTAGDEDQRPGTAVAAAAGTAGGQTGAGGLYPRQHERRRPRLPPASFSWRGKKAPTRPARRDPPQYPPERRSQHP